MAGDFGFGVIADTDGAAIIYEDHGKSMSACRIPEACNPSLASPAIEAVPDIGLLLPCNVLVRSTGEASAHVSFMDPESVLSVVDGPAVAELASNVRSRLERVRDAL